MNLCLLFVLFLNSSFLKQIPFWQDPEILRFSKKVVSDYFEGDVFSRPRNCAALKFIRDDESEAVIIFVTDANWDRIVYADKNKQWIKTYGISGDGVGRFDCPRGIDADNLGNIFVSDTYNDRIVHLRYDFEKDTINYVKEIKGSGRHKIRAPKDVCIDNNSTPENASDDAILVSNRDFRVFKFTRNGTFLYEIITDIPLSSCSGANRLTTQEAVLKGIQGEANTGKVYICGYNKVVMYEENGNNAEYSKFYWSGNANFCEMTVDSVGCLYLIDLKNSRVLKLSANLDSLDVFGKEGTGKDELMKPRSMVIPRSSSNCLIVERWSETSGLVLFQVLGILPPDTIPPVAKIFSPPNKTYVNHIVKIIGSVTDNQEIAAWGIYYAKGYPPEGGWIAIGGGANRIEEGILAEWNTYNLAEGLYTLRLVVQDEWGNLGEDSIIIYVGEPPLELIIGKQGHGDGELRLPTDVSIDTVGLIYISDTQNDRIQVYNASGNFLYKWGKHGRENGEFKQPSFSLICENKIYIADTYNNRFQIFTLLGYYLNSMGEKGHQPGNFNHTSGVDFYDNYLYLADIHHHQIHKYTKDGIYKSSFGEYGSEPGQLNQSHGLTIIDTFIYVADKQNNRVQKFTISGTLKRVIGTEGSEDGQFSHPIDIVVDSDSCFYVTDYHNNRFQKFDKYGYRLLTVYSEDDSLKMPSGVGIDRFMNTYVTDTHKNRVLKFPQKLDIDESITMTPPPKIATLLPSYPNPFTKIVMIQYGVPKKGQSGHASQGLLSGGQKGPQGPSITEQHRVILKIYDQIGRLVKTIVDEEKTPGWFRAVWIGEDNIGRKVSSGVYFIRLQIEAEIKTQKIVVIK